MKGEPARNVIPPVGVFFIILMTVALVPAFVGAADDFPLRRKYPALEPIATNEFAALLTTGEAIAVDVRTEAEFDVIHVKGAVRIPHMLNDESFETLKAAAAKPHEYLVFYCNGVLCTKSYKAAEIAVLRGFKGVRVYDAGIFEWAEAFPAETVFFGEPMSAADAKEKLIPRQEFEKALVDTNTFITMARSGKYEIYDIRDPRERVEYSIDLPNKKEATLDQFRQLLDAGKFPKSDVLLLDNVGKQVVWAQYYLKRFGVTNYFFLKGGVAQWRADGKNSQGEELGKVWGRSREKLIQELRDRAGSAK
ncbi:MAG: rhodanese-like domain-containing protein [Thermodesulfobacteriota bacterium]